MTNVINWTIETPIIIYGAAHRGGLLYERLKNRNCQIIGFIDKRSDEICEHKGLKVYKITADELKIFKKKAIIIICVANIFEHERIVLELIQYGFEYIIFCPVEGSLNKYRDENERRNMLDIYEILAENYDIKFPVTLPCIKGMFSSEIGSDIILCYRDERIVVPVPVPFVFSRGSRDTVDNMDNCVLSLFQIIELFNYFAGESEASYKNYININCINNSKVHDIKVTKRWIDNILSSRKEIYEQMSLNESINPDFSVKLAVNADWNDRKFYFNMVSGKHRAAFLIHMKKTFIPLALTKEDYNKYLNREIMSILFNYIKTTQLNELPYPLYHPYFLKFYSNPYNHFFIMFQQFILLFFKLYYQITGSISIKNISVLSFLPELEPVIQMLRKIGLKINCVYKPNEFDLIVRKLYYIYDMNNESNNYDLIICDSTNSINSVTGLYVYYDDEENIEKYKNCEIYFKYYIRNKIFLLGKVNEKN